MTGQSTGVRRCGATVLLIVFVSALTLLAQAPSREPAAPTPFDVVSVKRSTSAQNNGGWGPRPGGQFVATNVPIRPLIAYAYGIRDVQLIGGPGWLESDRFDIAAKAEAGADIPFDQLRRKLQLLLADRFKLVIHRDSREGAMYALIKARPDGALGPMLRPATVDCTRVIRGERPVSSGSRPVCAIIGNDGSIIGGGLTMVSLGEALAGRLNSVVVDETGLTGQYDFDLTFAPDVRTTGAAGSAEGPSLFTALQEQLGLRLRSQRGPIDVIVIDRVEPPADN